MRVAIVAELYPSSAEPTAGVWAHRQALAAREAGAALEVFALRMHAIARAHTRGAPLLEELDGIAVHSIGHLCSRSQKREARSQLRLRLEAAWAVRSLSRALQRSSQEHGTYDLVHAHGSSPAAAIARRALERGGLSSTPIVVSIHGADMLTAATRRQAADGAVAAGLRTARLALAGSEGVAQFARGHGAREARVVHLGTDIPEAGARGTPTNPRRAPTIVTVGALLARKRHTDVLRALAVLAERHPTLRYVIVGDGPQRVALEGLAARLGVADRVDLCGQLNPVDALDRARRCTLFVMPSTEEASSVSYVEAMAAGVPAIGCRGEPGPEEIAAAGGGFTLVPPGDIERLTQRIDELLSNPGRLREQRQRARETASAHFTWQACGAHTLAAYEHALS